MTASQPQDHRDRPLSWPLAMCVLAILAFAALWPLVGSPFAMWDDAEQLQSNPDLNPPTWSGLAQRWAGPAMNIYIPLTHTVWFVVAALGGEDPTAPVRALKAWPFKLTNILVHIGTSTIVFAIVRKLYPTRWTPLLAAAIFCVHPLQVEAIAWASGLKDLLLAFFGALCILFYLGDPAKAFHLSARAYALSVVWMVCACLSKPTALVLPAMLVVIDLFIAQRRSREIIGRLLPFAIVGVACAAYARLAQPAIDLDTKLTLINRVLVPMHTLAFYAGKIVWPTNLAFDYGMNWNYLIGSTRLLVAWIVPVAIALTAFLLRRRFPLLGPALLLAIIPLAPVSGVVIFDFSYYSITADHYLCLPLVGIAIALAEVTQRAPVRLQLGFGAVVLAVLVVLTTRQSFTWESQRRSLEHLLSINPNSFSAYSVMAITEVAESNGDPQKLKLAEEYARKSLQIRPDHPRSMSMLANVLAAQGRYEEALEMIDQAIAIIPSDPQHHLAKAGILGAMHRGREAISELRIVLRLEPNNRLARELVKKWEETVELPASRSSPASMPAKNE